MGSSNRPWNPLCLSTTGLSTHKARRASAGWAAAKQLACQSRGRHPRPERQCSQSRGPPPATRTAVFPIADVLAGLALTNRGIVLAIVAIRIFSMAVWIEARAGGLLCRTHSGPPIRSASSRRTSRCSRKAALRSRIRRIRPLPILARYLGTLHRSSDDAIRARLGAGRQLMADEGVVRVD